MSKDDSTYDSIISEEKIREWEEEQKRLAERIRQDQLMYEKLEALVKAGKSIHSMTEAAVLDAVEDTDDNQKSLFGGNESKKLVWTDTIEMILKNANAPMDYSQLKEELYKTELGEKLKKNEKSFYGAVLKLSDQKRIVKDHGLLFSPRAYEKFRNDLDAGLVDESRFPKNNRRSPFSDAVKDALKKFPNGATGAKVRKELSKMPEFKEQASPYNSQTYNTLGRLASKGEVIRSGNLYYLPEFYDDAPLTKEVEP